MDTDFLDWALADFSGYVAADELYDGPFCMLSAVDNRCYKRLLYDVLDHDPTHDDIRAFLRRLKTALAARDLTLWGVTTDGSALYPHPLAEVVRGGAASNLPVSYRGRGGQSGGERVWPARARRLAGSSNPNCPEAVRAPSGQAGGPHEKAAGSATRRVVHLIGYLFVQRHLNKTERKTLWRVSRGFPQLRAACDHGAGVCVIRSALSDPDRPGQTGQTAASAPAVHPRWATRSRSSLPPPWKRP